MERYGIFMNSDNKVRNEEVKNVNENIVDDNAVLNVQAVSFVIKLDDGSGYVLPLSELQTVFSFKMLGIHLDKQIGKPTCYSDKELNEVYHLV